MADLKLIPSVPEGSILVLTGVGFTGPSPDPDDPEAAILVDDAEVMNTIRKQLIHEIEKVCGHRRFLILELPGSGDLELWGPDDDIAAKTRALLESAGIVVKYP